MPASTRRGLLTGMLIFVTGALAMEAAGGAVAEAQSKLSYLYMLLAHIEEFLEMAGLVVVIKTLATHLATANLGLLFGTSSEP